MMKESILDKLFSGRGFDESVSLPETVLAGLESAEAREALAEVVLALFQRWAVPGRNQAELLGRADLAIILRDKILPNDPELLQRVGHLLGIERALKSRFPYTPAVRDHWVWRENEGLAGRMPMEVMLADGLAGIRRAREVAERQAGAVHGV